MRQRVMVAMATAHRPNVLLADEPTTALDVTTQAQVLDLLRSLRSETGSSLVLVTHDLGVVAENADRVLVMYAGRMVECGPAHVVLQEPEHPYTIGLLASALELDSERGVAYTIPGQPPSGAERPTGCMFHPRCKLGSGRRACREDVPPMMSRPLGRSCACWYVEESHSLNVSPGRSGSK
jgi:oligopeptide/dipeptide ABC transporter ATP-binding protein